MTYRASLTWGHTGSHPNLQSIVKDLSCTQANCQSSLSVRNKGCCFSRLFHKDRCDTLPKSFVYYESSSLCLYLWVLLWKLQRHQRQHFFFSSIHTNISYSVLYILKKIHLWLQLKECIFAYILLIYIFLYIIFCYYSSYFRKSCILLSWDFVKTFRKKIGSIRHLSVEIGNI